MDRMKSAISLTVWSLLFLLVLALPEARAQQRGFLLLDRPLQYVDFNYQFRNQDTSSNGRSTSSDSHRLSPGYFLGLNFAILDPNIFIGNISGSARFDQAYYSGSSESSLYNFYNTSTSGSSSGWRLYYSLSGNIMRRKPVSAAFIAYRTQDWIQQDFAPGYNATTDYLNISSKYRGPVLPTLVRYTYSKTDADNSYYGARTYKNSLLELQSNHTYNSLSQTDLSLQYQKTSNSDIFTPEQTYYQFMASLNNSLLWNFSRNTSASLTSGFTYSNYHGDAYSLNSYQINESMNWFLGRAFKTGANYSYSAQNGSSLNVTDASNSQHSNAVNIWAEHQLYDSLRTRIAGLANFNNYTYGYQNSASGIISLDYNKKLPREAVLTLNFSDTYQRNEQKLSQSTVVQYNEQILVTDITQRYPLNFPSVTTIIEVWDKTQNFKCDTPADYGIETFGFQTFITINPTGRIHTNDVLLVTYGYQLNTDTTYATNTISGGASLSLMNNHYRIFTQYSQTTPYLISGIADYQNQSISRYFNAGIQSFYANGTTLGFRYNYADTYRNQQNYFYAYWWYNGRYGINTYNLTLSDTYTIDNPQHVVFGKSQHLNTLQVSANVSRPVFRNGQIQLSANYLMTRIDTIQDNFYVTLTYSMRLGKFLLWCTAQSLLNDTSAVTMWNNSINLTMRRYF